MPNKLITINKNWLAQEKELIKTLAKIIKPNDDFEPFDKHTAGIGGWKWQLDRGNDWFAHIENGALIISYRYSKEKLDALASWAEFYFNN